MGRIILVIILLFGLGFLIYKFIPQASPKSLIQNLSNSTPTNTNTSSNLVLPLSVGDGQVKTFVDLKGELPRALAFDPNGVLLTSVPAKGKIIALIDSDKNGEANEIKTVVSGLNQPHGIAFDSGYIYIGETDKVVRYIYDKANLTANSRQELFTIPGGGRHFTRTIRINNGKLYTTVGSSCDTCVDKDLRASILISDLDGKNLREFARGLRNTVFFTFDDKGQMWGADMGRDFLGDNLPPEEVNLIEDGGDYGWPYCYGNKIRDSKFMNGENMDYCSKTKAPIFEMPAHIAPLGITFDPEGNLLIAQHGSWNSTTPVGYKVVKLTKSGNTISKMEDYLIGFISNRNVSGRPVDLIFDSNKNLFISDDKAGLVYKIHY